MNLEKFLSERLTKEQMEGLNTNSTTMEERKEDNKLTIELPKELVDIINSNYRGKNILKRNIVKFMRGLKSDLELERGI